MKQLVALFLALSMLIVLTACGSDSPSGLASETPDESQSQSEPEAYDTSAWDSVVFTVATADNENDYSSLCLQWFFDQVETLSDGKITFNVFYGGTYCTLAEEFENVSNGAIDMTLWNQSSNSDIFPMAAFTGLAAGNEEALELTNYMVYENTETAELYEKYATANNVKMLGYIPAGYSLFCSTSEVANFSDFSNITFGTMLNASLWESLGFNVVSCAPADMYESLSRGVVDSVCQAFPSAISRMLYEVASYGMLTGYSAVCYNFLFNLDTWNSLNLEQQSLLQAAMDDLEPYSIDLYNTLHEQWIETWESATGNAIVSLSEADANLYIENSYKMNYATYSEIANRLGQGDDFEIIVDAHNEYLGIDCRADVG